MRLSEVGTYFLPLSGMREEGKVRTCSSDQIRGRVTSLVRKMWVMDKNYKEYKPPPPSSSLTSTKCLWSIQWGSISFVFIFFITPPHLLWNMQRKGTCLQKLQIVCAIYFISYRSYIIERESEINGKNEWITEIFVFLRPTNKKRFLWWKNKRNLNWVTYWVGPQAG